MQLSRLDQRVSRKKADKRGRLLAAEIFLEIYHAVAYQLSLIVSIAFSACVTLAFAEGYYYQIFESSARYFSLFAFRAIFPLEVLTIHLGITISTKRKAIGEFFVTCLRISSAN